MNRTHLERKRIFFRNNGLSPTEIVKFWRHNGKLTLPWPQFENREVIFTHLGRIGNVLVCKLIKIQADDEILVPSYNCGSEVDPFIWFGMKPVMYRVDESLNIDVDDLFNRITARTKIVYVTHYFGWPQELRDIIYLCLKHDLFLIEDCALSLFSNSADGPIGRVGDAAIHSFRKTLPVPDGAALVLRAANRLESLPEIRPSLLITASEIAPYIARWLLHWMYNNPVVSNSLYYVNDLFPQNSSQSVLSETLDMPSDYYFSDEIMPLTISRISAGILRATNPETVVNIRRKNYQRLFEGIADISLLRQLLRNLPDGVCPLLMPIVVDDVLKWIRELNSMGIKAIRWWEGFNQKLSWEAFPEAKKLKMELLVLPVHQYLNEDDIDYMIDCAQKVAKTKC
ncbi:DegT/DnrJ/EryC1/StrS family aminotransferase [candidate division KSB1 bacterium]|nr:DegT/DnrJ/EryC1/StrS family aminotransferase [candidate division KSB1 bacterium]